MRKKTAFFSILFFLYLLAFVFVLPARAEVTPPEFPSCVNPQGKITANYSSGTHAIVGVVTLYQGSDTVYAVSDSVVVQCLCTTDGEGIQTNWWKIQGLTSEQIETYKTQGWVFVPDGSAWGLDPAAYLAKNVNFSCRAIGGGGGSSNAGNGGSSAGGSVGGISSIGQILALATTGNILTIYGLLLLGILSISFGYLLKRGKS